jgi:hypothetical protein
MKNLVIACMLVISSNTFAADTFTRNYAIQMSMTSHTDQVKPVSFWISSYSTEKKPMYFTNASGASIMSNPSSVVSGYDSTSTRYSVSNFYALQNDRQRLVGHINGFSKGELFSIGYDSGISAQKLNVNNALYAGYTKSMSFTKSSLTAISFGSWFGGKTSESPCVDSYGRQYSCQTLTAWGDYKPNYPKPLAFIDLRHVWVFD